MEIHLITIFAAAIGWLIAGLFFQAGLSKLSSENRAYYVKAIDGYGVVPVTMLAYLPTTIGMLEILISLLILFPPTTIAGLLLASCLLVVYLLVFAKQILQGKADINCGCAGPGADLKISPMLLVRNAALVALCLFAINVGAVRIDAAWFMVLPLATMLALIYMSCDQLIANQQKCNYWITHEFTSDIEHCFMALVIVMGVVIFALTRQIGVLFERVAPAGALAMNQNLQVGESAPQLSLPSLNNGLIEVGGTTKEGKSQLVFFASPDCPVCKTLLPAFKSAAKKEADWLDVVIGSDGKSQDHEGFVEQQGLQAFPYIVSELLGKTYGVAKLPYAVLIDEAGTIASLGIVNSREHLDSLFEAKERKAASIQDYMNDPKNRNATGADASSVKGIRAKEVTLK